MTSTTLVSPETTPPVKKTTGERVIEFIEKFCKIPEGKFVGEQLLLKEWQKRELINIYDNPYATTRRAILSFGRKNGKGLALDTLIPTPHGFTTMGKLRIGDRVFDECGRPCQVSYVSPVHLGLRCWRLTFSDGSSIVADEEHRWLTRHSYRPWAKARVNSSGYGGNWREEVITTPQIAESLYRARQDGGREHNHKLTVAGALKCPDVDLPIPPYVFGYWLGDGNSSSAVVTVGTQDEREFQEQFEYELGFELRLRAVSGSRAPQYSLSRDGHSSDKKSSIHYQLRLLGVLGDKHIPDIYKWASHDQRRALLQGLMDSDGSVSGNPKSPRCYFDVMNEQLARDTLHIVRSLGFKAGIREDRAMLNGRDVGPCWSVSFTASKSDEVFRLPRKHGALLDQVSKRGRSNSIVACEEVASVPTVCIQVDSPSHLFLAGEGLTPTHNTCLSACIVLVHLCGPLAKKNSQLFSAAQSRDQAAILFALAAKMVVLNPKLLKLITIRETAKELICEERGTRYRALSAEATTAFGLSPSLVIHDELGQVRGPRSALYEALETASGAQEDPLSIVISTQAPTDNDLLSILIDDAMAGHDPAVVVKLYTAPKEDNPFSEETIRLANPAYGEFLNAKEVLAMAADAERMPAREAEYRNLILNQRIEVNNPFIAPAIWKGCSGEIGSLSGCAVYAGLDLSEVSDLTALVMVGKRDDGRWHIHPTFWLPTEGLAEKSVADHVPYDLWAEQGFLQLTPGHSISYKFVAEHIASLMTHLDIRKIAFDRWNFKHLKPWLNHAGISEQKVTEKFVEFGQGVKSMSPALRDLEQMLLEGDIVHGGNPVLSMCVSNTIIVLDDAGNRKPSKRKSVGRIDGLVALAMAIGVIPEAPIIDVASLIG